MAGLGLSVRMQGVYMLDEFSVTMVLLLMIGNVQGFLADPDAQAAGPLCYSCLHVAHQRDCTRIVQCGPHEKCFGRRFITPDGLIYFSSGCESKAGCGARRSILQDESNTQSKDIMADNGDLQACDQCCDGSYCNLQLCDVPIKLKQRCLFCDDVINPEDCNLSLQCDEDQICYTENIYVNDEKRFRMGCATKSGCVVATPSGAPVGVLGKRDREFSFLHRYRKALPTDRKYCAKCCTGENCNRDLCTARPVINQYQLVAPPPLVLCQDYDEASCRSGLVDANFCQDLVNKRLFCPRTCNTCSGGGIPLPVTTAITTTGGTTTADVCTENNPNKCQQYKDFFCDPSNSAGIDVCPVTCNKPGCSSGGSTVNPVTVSTKPTLPPCTDPIPPCQCEYLQNKLQICYDGDQELQKFCCFYCKKVRDPNWVCSTDDKTFCDAYEKPFAQEINGINITCHH